MINEAPEVSVLVTCYNSMAHIVDVLDSLFIQEFANFEIVVIDDHSKDETLALLKSLATKNPCLKVYSNPSKGRGKALNFGLKMCIGKYVAINDADDFSLPNRLKKQYDFLENNIGYGLVGSMSDLKFLDSGKVITNHSAMRPVTDSDIRKYFTIGQPIQHVTVMFRKDLAVSLGGYNERIKFLFDRDLFLKIAQVSKLHNLNEVLVMVGEHSGRYFKSNFTGVQRSWQSSKYQMKAVDLFGFTWSIKVTIIAKFLWSLVLNLKRSIF